MRTRMRVCSRVYVWFTYPFWHEIKTYPVVMFMPSNKFSKWTFNELCLHACCYYWCCFCILWTTINCCKYGDAKKFKIKSPLWFQTNRFPFSTLFVQLYFWQATWWLNKWFRVSCGGVVVVKRLNELIKFYVILSRTLTFYLNNQIVLLIFGIVFFFFFCESQITGYQELLCLFLFPKWKVNLIVWNEL